MNQHEYDCIIVGGGLAGSLLFYGLKSTRPDANVILLEKDNQLCGNHTWSFHKGDLDIEEPWLKDLVSKSWPEYEVLFPKFRRLIKRSYHSIRSHELEETLNKKFSKDIMLNSEVLDLTQDKVVLLSGKVLKGRCVVDARGWSVKNESVVGYQKFVGLDLKLKEHHPFKCVRLKDVEVEQVDGYRFFYVLPWSSTELLIEDTYYSNNNKLDREKIKERIYTYLNKHGCEVDSVVREEFGCLPLVTKTQSTNDRGVIELGASSGDYHPVTGYTFPQTYNRVSELLALRNFNPKDWEKKLLDIRRKDSSNRSYFHFLNRMLFLGAIPEKRYLVLERFYSFPVDLIERFYRGRLSPFDRLKILSGRPPISIVSAIKSIFKKV